MEKYHFNQAKLWLGGAKYIANYESEDRDKYSIGVAMLVHSVIKANDALTFKFLNTTARRHDDARRLFEDLVRRNYIKSEFSSYKDIIQEAINNKSNAEYRVIFFSKNDFESFKRKAEKFLRMTEQVIDSEKFFKMKPPNRSKLRGIKN